MLMSATAYAAPSSNNQNVTKLTAQIRKVSQQAQALQKEVTSLRTELAKMKRTQHQQIRTHHSVKNNVARYPHFHHAPTVTTSPLMSIYSTFTPFDLLVEAPTMNEDLILLHRRDKFEQKLLSEGHSLYRRPMLVISGGLEGQILNSSGFGGARSDVNLSMAEIDLNALIDPWVSGFFSLDFDDSQAATGSRVPNSQLYLKRGFITIGNLNKFPFYFTIGQMYVPFGHYASMMVTTPLTESLARVRVRAALLGFSSNGFYVSGYGYRGNQTTGSENEIFKQGGANIGLKEKFKHGHFDVGTGYISSIADSEGMQNNALPELAMPQFRGFGERTASGSEAVPNLNDLRHRVPAYNFHAELELGQFNFLFEYINVLRGYDPKDMSFNGDGAKPGALHAEVDYLFHWFNRPFVFGLIYGQTWEALALNLPHRSYAAVLAATIWKNTREALEFRHDENYDGVATGGTVNGRPLSVPDGDGESRNMVTLQVGVYF